MAKEVILGEFNKIADTMPAESQAKFEFHPIDLMTHWKRCGLLADFIGAFYSFGNPPRIDKDENMLMNLSTVVNELIENAAKFSRQRAPVSIQLKHYSSILQIEVTNQTVHTVAQNFQKIANKLLSENIEELYFKSLEERDENDNKTSGIGLMMILKDYPVQMAFRFKELEDGKHTEITTKAYISVQGV
ncbi:MAG TPA: histidine kinase [Turneriella sp.]|nr:histidine kinase [Turneriella sp.]